MLIMIDNKDTPFAAPNTRKSSAALARKTRLTRRKA
jgi:hypothetical protein